MFVVHISKSLSETLFIHYSDISKHEHANHNLWSGFNIFWQRKDIIKPSFYEPHAKPLAPLTRSHHVRDKESLMDITIYLGNYWYMYRMSPPKKHGFVFRAHFRGYWLSFSCCTVIEPLGALSGGEAAECISSAGQLYITKYLTGS